jgi:hypothetical protein
MSKTNDLRAALETVAEACARVEAAHGNAKPYLVNDLRFLLTVQANIERVVDPIMDDLAKLVPAMEASHGQT